MALSGGVECRRDGVAAVGADAQFMSTGCFSAYVRARAAEPAEALRCMEAPRCAAPPLAAAVIAACAGEVAATVRWAAQLWLAQAKMDQRLAEQLCVGGESGVGAHGRDGEGRPRRDLPALCPPR